MFQDMKVGTRLALAFGVVLVLLVGVIMVGVSRMASINEALRTITEENNEQIRHAQEIRAASYATGQGVRSLIILTEESALKAEYEKLQETSKTYDAEIAALGEMFMTPGTTPQEKSLFAKMVDLRKPVPALVEKVAELAMANKNTEAAQVQIKDFSPANAAVRDAIEELVSFENKLNEDAAAEAERNYNSARTMM